MIQKENAVLPLLIFSLFFAGVFLLELCCFVSDTIMKEKALSRYQAVEHPRRRTCDRYIDLLG